MGRILMGHILHILRLTKIRMDDNGWDYRLHHFDRWLLVLFFRIK